MSNSPITVLGFAGSLRTRSYNRALIRATRELAPPEMTIKVYDLNDIPLYNGDIDNDESRPASIEHFKNAIAAADGVLISTPEYNLGIPGVLKNALDWASRPVHRPMIHKPTAIMGASPGGSGAMRAQEQLKLNLLGIRATLYPHPGVAVSRCRDKFDDDLRLTDEKTRSFLEKHLTGFADWIQKSKG